MVQERTLLKLAFIVSIIGIVLLYLFADSIVLPETRLNETQGMDGKTINVFGVVKSVRNKVSDNNDSSSTILTIEQTNTITVYADDVINVSKGDNVEVLGRLDDEGKIVYSEEIKVKK
ncbi:hypothetical protein J4434_00110 [Candidatus Woesearchaeota archaeon]|nr:hypothetical protein [Candidatus Woesearchaeota archaeon]